MDLPHDSLSRRSILGLLAAPALAAGQTDADARYSVPFADKDAYPDGEISYSKGLPHNALGAVEREPFRALRRGLLSGDPQVFEEILLGGTMRLANPMGAFAREMYGPDPASVTLREPPLFSSDEQAAEMVELYWQALGRDVHFEEYDSDPLIAAACADLSALPSFREPRESGRVTAQTLFRGTRPGDQTGPYVSQFLVKDIQYGPITVPQRIAAPEQGLNYGTTFSQWIAIQNGQVRVSNPHEPIPRYYVEPGTRYIRNGRDLSEVVHRDFTYQICLNAALILMSLKVPIDKGNPYYRSGNQTGFCTFGEAHLLDLLARVVNCALKAAWYQKWIAYLRIRPEEFGGRIQVHRTGAVRYPLSSLLDESEAPDRVHNKYETYLLPLSYPEGCPTHPAYPSGHAVVAGACTTVLKAYFDESFEIRGPVVASPDGHSLAPYEGPALRVGAELDKLASNIAYGRNFAGIHWRTDAEHGMAVGEEVALAILRQVGQTCIEQPCWFSVTKFDGSTVRV